MRIKSMLMASLILDFMLEQLPTLLIQAVTRLTSRKQNRSPISIDRDDNSSEFDDSISSDDMTQDLGDATVWFDGVDKRLIEAHSTPVEKLVEPYGRGTLLTKTPLISYKALVKRRKGQLEHHSSKSSSASSSELNKSNGNHPAKLHPYKDTIKPSSGITDELAVDCEMVGIHGNRSVLARVSIVNLFGHPLYDTYVAPPSQVHDYRTRYSGIRKQDLDDAPTFAEVQTRVARLIKNKIIVGHAVHNDFEVLKLDHPKEYIRDTSKYFGRVYYQGKLPSLKRLSDRFLGVKIQQGEHDSIQDAQATMKLYVTVRERWEHNMLKKYAKDDQKKAKKQKTKPKKRKIKTFYVETL